MSVDQDLPPLSAIAGVEASTGSVERAAPPNVGDRLRARRKTRGLSVRELARRLGVSASLISQIETGRATPSVATLYAVTTELGLSLDELFSEQVPTIDRRLDGHTSVRPGSTHASRPTNSPVVSAEQRKAIQLDTGVSWERLTHAPDPSVEFLHVVYQPGSASCDTNALMRHNGHEYGYVLSGTLCVTLGFEDHLLRAGDSISFESSRPHRLAAVGDEPVEAIWVVVDRSADPRVH